MCAKKKAAPNKMWRIAGEPLQARPLNTAEQKQLADGFYVHRLPYFIEDISSTWVTPAVAKRHQSAAQAVAAFLCERYAGRYDRETVIEVVSTVAAIPIPSAERMAKRQEFLLGAALWLLDYLEAHCEERDEYLALLPPESDETLEFDLAFTGDLIHSWETIQRTMAVLRGREKEYRKEFRALMALIHEDDAVELRRQFKAAFLDYTDRILKIHDRLQPVNKQPLPDFGPGLPGLERMLEEDIPPSQRPEVIALLMGTELICRPVAEIQNLFHSKKAAELLSGYGTDDPYALCAAYLLLEQEKDALVNLNNLTAVVMVCAARHLPWGQDDLGLEQEPFEQGRPDYRLRYECCGVPGDDEDDESSPKQLLSEAQLFYQATGVAPPRNQQPSEALIRWFISQGVAEQRAREMAWGAMYAYYTDAGEYGWKEVDWSLDDEDEVEDVPSSEEEPVLSSTPPAEDHAAQIEALTRRVKELRSALHEAERTLGRMKEQLQDMEQKGEAERAELVQLRETLYQLRFGDQDEAMDRGPLVELPWQVKRRVAVFGGHDSWCKAVKPLLPGARFYGKDELPDLNIVRSADVVWLQVNALSHKYYYRIIDAARKNDIPVRYFGSSSARKCAVQLAMDELAEEKKTE